MGFEMYTATLASVFLVLAITGCTAAPSDVSELIERALQKRIDELKNSSSNGDVSRVDTTINKVSEPGKSTTAITLLAGASTKNGTDVAASAIGGVAEAVAGDGIAATLSNLDGGAGTDGNKATSDGTALLGAIAIKDGSISTTTVIAKTAADSKGGSGTNTLGITSSRGPDGEAFGIQQTQSQTGASEDSTTHADQSIGSSVADIATRVILAAGSTAQQNATPTARPEPRFSSVIEEAKKEFAEGLKN